MKPDKPCSVCGGAGVVEWEEIVGYVTHDMAMDAQDMSYEGYPLYAPIQAQCEHCEGTGIEPEEII